MYEGGLGVPPLEEFSNFGSKLHNFLHSEWINPKRRVLGVLLLQQDMIMYLREPACLKTAFPSIYQTQ